MVFVFAVKKGVDSMARKRANGEAISASGQMAAGRAATPQDTTQKPVSASSRMSSARRRRSARQKITFSSHFADGDPLQRAAGRNPPW